jgi:mannosyltransferase
MMIAGIMLLAALVRSIGIGQSLWLDEAIEALALRGHYGALAGYAVSDFQPPLYHYLLSGWTALAGYGEIALRLPSYVASLGTVIYLYLLGKHIGGTRTGLWAALLAALNPLLVYYATEGRTYALTTFLVAASMYYLLKTLHTQKYSLFSIFYFLFTLLYLWTSYLTWFLWVGIALYLGYTKRFRLLGLHLLAALTLVAWIPSFLTSFQLGTRDAIATPGWGRVVGGASLKALALTWVKFSLGRISFAATWLYGLVVGATALLHLSLIRATRRKVQSLDRDQLWLYVIWGVVPVVLGLGISLFVPVYSYTRVLFVLPAYILVLALGLSTTSSRAIRFAILAIQCLALGYYWLTPRFHKEDWRALTHDILTYASREVVLPSTRQDPALVYYLPSEKIRATSEALGEVKTILHIAYVEDAFDPGRRGRTHLSELGYTLTAQKVYPGLQLDIYTRVNGQ